MNLHTLVGCERGANAESRRAAERRAAETGKMQNIICAVYLAYNGRWRFLFDVNNATHSDAVDCFQAINEVNKWNKLKISVQRYNNDKKGRDIHVGTESLSKAKGGQEGNMKIWRTEHDTDITVVRNLQIEDGVDEVWCRTPAEIPRKGEQYY